MAIRVSYQYQPDEFARLVVAISEVDQMTAATARTMGTAARAAYRTSVPSKRVAKAVVTRRAKKGTTYTVRTGVANRPMGEPVHGRDPYTAAVGWWLEHGTGHGTGRANRQGDGLIRRTDPSKPFFLFGRELPFVRGQAAQPWVRGARGAADAVGATLAADLNERVSERLARA
ncbi:MAG: hypothetical protein AAGC46_19445 [Solirubrobacteraceae bacterium]